MRPGPVTAWLLMSVCWLMHGGCGGDAPKQSVRAEVAAPAELAPKEPKGGDGRLQAPSCAPCTLLEQVDGALWRLGPFLADWEGETNLDAAIAVHEIREVVSSDALDRAWERVRAVADKDSDHPHRRVWAEMQVAPTNTWSMPEEGRPNLNKLMAEALWCDVHPIREETLAYLHTAMLDEGGYWSTHAAWSLAEARSRGCIDQARFALAAEPIRTDLLEHQPSSLSEPTLPELDLFAERTLGLLWLGYRGPEIERSVEVILEHQREDGAWGEPGAEDNPYYGYHAAFVAGWALAEWRRAYSSGEP